MGLTVQYGFSLDRQIDCYIFHSIDSKNASKPGIAKQHSQHSTQIWIFPVEGITPINMLLLCFQEQPLL